MEQLFKIITDDDGRVSLIIYKPVGYFINSRTLQSLTELLENTVNVVDFAFDNARISERDRYYHFKGLNKSESFDTIISFIEEFYNRFIF